MKIKEKKFEKLGIILKKFSWKSLIFSHSPLPTPTLCGWILMYGHKQKCESKIFNKEKTCIKTDSYQCQFPIFLKISPFGWMKMSLTPFTHCFQLGWASGGIFPLHLHALASKGLGILKNLVPNFVLHFIFTDEPPL